MPDFPRSSPGEKISVLLGLFQLFREGRGKAFIGGGEHAFGVLGAPLDAPEAGNALLRVYGRAVRGNGLHGTLPHAQAAVDAVLCGGGHKAAPFAPLFIGAVSRRGEVGPACLQVLPGLQGKGPVLIQIVGVRPPFLNGAIGVFPHQSGAGKRCKPMFPAEVCQLQQGVVKIPVAIGDRDQAGGVVPLQGSQAFQGSLKYPGVLDRGA